MKSGTGMRTRLHHVHDSRRHQQADTNADRYLPADDLFYQQPESAESEKITDPFPATSAEIAHDRYRSNFGNCASVIQAGLHHVQRCCATYCVNGNPVRQGPCQRECQCLQNGQLLIIKITHARRDPQIEMHRESNQDDNVASHCRIKNVIAEAAVQVLRDNDGEKCTGRRHPPRCKRWQGECQ